MSFFRVNSDKPFEGPHQDTKVYTHGATLDKAKTAMILIHGRGASAQSMFPLADEFETGDVHYVAPQARNYAWYPSSFLAPIEQNQPGISSGLQLIHDLVNSLQDKGFNKSHIMLLGFSQRACLATEFAARHPQRYGGIVGLSGGLIGPELHPHNYEGSFSETPVFLGCSDRDPHIPKERVDETATVLNHLEANVTKKIYPGMGHTVNKDEIEHVNRIVNNIPSS